MLRVPKHLTVYVNWMCNLTCRECWMYGDSAAESKWLADVKRDEISLDLWDRLIGELAEHGSGKQYLTIMGGEPLIHPEIVELVARAKRVLPDSNIDMSTNATLLARHAEGLVRAGLDDIYISIDGPSTEVNDPIRGRRAFERAMVGLSALQDAIRRAGRGPKIALNFVVTGMNYTHLPEMVRLTEKLGVNELTVGLSSYFTRAEGEASRKAFETVTGRPFDSWAGYCNEHQHADIDPSLLHRMLDEAERASGSVRVLIAPTRYDNEEKSRFFTTRWASQIRDRTCVKLWAQSTVLPNGDVISCTTFPDTVMGSIRDRTLSEVFGGEIYTNLRSSIGSGLQPVCYRCCELNMDIDVDPELYQLAPTTTGGAEA